MKRLIPSLPDGATLGDVWRRFPDRIAPLARYVHAVMREPGPLDVADREVIAAYVSGLNACAYCTGAHTVFARALGVPPETITALLDDPATAPVDDRLRPLLAYAGKLTVEPAKMAEADAEAVYAAGWSEEALFDAVQVCGLYNLMNRMLEGAGVDAYGQDPAALEEAALAPRRKPDAYLAFARTHGIEV